MFLKLIVTKRRFTPVVLLLELLLVLLLQVLKKCDSYYGDLRGNS